MLPRALWSLPYCKSIAYFSYHFGKKLCQKHLAMYLLIRYIVHAFEFEFLSNVCLDKDLNNSIFISNKPKDAET